MPISVETLYCNNNIISKLDNFSLNLERLSCQKNEINILENLPDSLNFLNCDGIIQNLEQIRINNSNLRIVSI